MDKVADAAIDNIVMVVVVLAAWSVALLAWLFRIPPLTLFLIFSVLLVGALVWSVPRCIRAYRYLKNLRLGRDGERTVAENLDPLRADGHVVLHDLTGPGFNVDHVLVGPTGVYAVETKTLSKRNGQARVVHDGETILVDGRSLDRDPLAQVRAEARWLRGVLKDMTGRDFEVRPVVTFPGWYVDRRNRAVDGAWVVEPKAIVGYVAKEPVRLRSEDVALIANRLKLLARQPSPAN